MDNDGQDMKSFATYTEASEVSRVSAQESLLTAASSSGACRRVFVFLSKIDEIGHRGIVYDTGKKWQPQYGRKQKPNLPSLA